MASLKSQQRISLSSSSLGYINEDIVTMISFYLPVRSILRFRSVSKKWYSLLTDTHFIQSYASNKSRKSCLFFELDDFKYLPLKGEAADFDFDFGCMKNSCQDNLYLKTSCNGLLLFMSEDVRGHQQQSPRFRFYVCNPCARKYTGLLAIPDYIANARANVIVYLAFDPTKSPHYKIIFFSNDYYGSCDFHVDIYSSETTTCKKLGHTFNTNNAGIRIQSGVFLNGAIHWVCQPRNMSLIFYFDINQESFGSFSRPPHTSTRQQHWVPYFGAWRGHLNVIFFDAQQPVFDVYEFKEDNSSWYVKYKVDLHSIAVDFPEIRLISNEEDKYSDPSFCCLFEEDEEDPTLVLSFENQLLLIAYNLIDKTTRKLCDLPPSIKGKFISWPHMTFYCIESLYGF